MHATFLDTSMLLLPAVNALEDGIGEVHCSTIAQQ